MEAGLATARIQLHADINFGDPIWPTPTEAQLPLLLGGELHLRGYPDHMVLAEKIITAVDRGQINTRWRDFVDITAIIGTRRIDYADLRTAIERVARHRDIELEPLAPLLEEMPGLAQRKWVGWRQKQQLETSTPDNFGDLLDACAKFADPVIEAQAEGTAWDPDTHEWR